MKNGNILKIKLFCKDFERLMTAPLDHSLDIGEQIRPGDMDDASLPFRGFISLDVPKPW